MARIMYDGKILMVEYEEEEFFFMYHYKNNLWGI